MDGHVGLFHPGVQHSWQTALALQQLGRLSFYASSIFYQPDRWPYRVERLLPPRLRTRVHAEFARFAYPALDPKLVHSAGAAEWLERIARRAGWHEVAARLDALGNRHFATHVEKLVAREQPSILWGYNGSALEAFISPVATGRARVLDRTIGDWRAYRAIMADVIAAYPDFVPPKRFDIAQATIARDDREYAAADVIVAGSPFAAETIRAHAPAVADRVRVLPYCFDEGLFTASPPRPSAGDPVRFLFLGQAGVRKGIHLVLEALARIPASAATLTVVGDLQIPPATFARYADRIQYRSTVARADVPAIMAAHDVLLFPSYFEGSALSLIEGLASGLALIQSRAAGLGATPATGIVLPELSEGAVHAAMMTLIDDRPRLAAMQAAAPAEAENYRFSRYRDGVAGVLDSLR